MSSPIESLPTRSLMFVPGSKQRMIAKSVTMINLDLAIYDIEDGVAPQEKPLARKLIGELLASPRSNGAPLRYVRINRVGSGAERIDADLALIGPGLDGVVIPKVESVEQLEYIDSEISRCERSTGAAPGAHPRYSRRRKPDRTAQRTADCHKFHAAAWAVVRRGGLFARAAAAVQPRGRGARARVCSFVVCERRRDRPRRSVRWRLARHK